jgi:hypothetical protein
MCASHMGSGLQIKDYIEIGFIQILNLET